MSGMRQEKKKQVPMPELPVQVTEETVKKQLSLAAGTEQFQHRDPIYHLTESFRQTFDLMGQQRARGDRPDLNAMLQVYMREEVPGLGGAETSQGEPVGAGRETGGQPAGFFPQTRMDTAYEPRDRDPQNPLMSRFADVTFQRGNLSAAVIGGTGKMMLFSCLERTVGQQEVKQRKERKLFQSNSVHQMIPGRREDLAVVNRDFTDSAVGLVVDVLKDARQVLDSLTAMAEGKSGVDQSSGVGTLQKQYPFLTDEKERGLLEQYRERLEQLKGPGHEEEREVLLRAQEKTEAIIGKKNQMKRDFLQKLRYLSHCAAEAAEAFSREDFLREAAQRLVPTQPDEPPEGEDGSQEDEDL